MGYVYFVILVTNPCFCTFLPSLHLLNFVEVFIFLYKPALTFLLLV